jgi:hypothetical protein
MRGGAVLDGTEVAALLISRRSHLLKVGDVILLLNVVIFSVAAFLLGINIALYSILTYIAASKTIDFPHARPGRIHAVIIVSDQDEAIRQAITHTAQTGRSLSTRPQRHVGRRPGNPVLRGHPAGDRPGKSGGSRNRPAGFHRRARLVGRDGGLVSKKKLH